MRSFLLQPYPFSDNVQRKLLVCGGIGLFIALFLAVFKPFDIGLLPYDLQWKHSLLFGAVSFFISGIFQIILSQIFPVFFKEQTWRSWKEILYLLLTTVAIGAGNFGLMYYLYPQNDGTAGFLKAELMTLQVGVFPVVAIVFMKQLTLYRRFAAEAKEVTESMQEEEKEDPGTPPPKQSLTLRGDGQKEEVTLSPDDLAFIASADNYVNLCFKESGVLKSLLLRSSLKKMEEQLAAYPVFFRCHRMYVVNLKLVESVSGNAQGLRLQVAGAMEAIPVSRSLTDEVKSRLHALSHSPQNAG